jgi:hypothetical protein
MDISIQEIDCTHLFDKIQMFLDIPSVDESQIPQDYGLIKNSSTKSGEDLTYVPMSGIKFGTNGSLDSATTITHADVSSDQDHGLELREDVLEPYMSTTVTSNNNGADDVRNAHLKAELRYNGETFPILLSLPPTSKTDTHNEEQIHQTDGGDLFGSNDSIGGVDAMQSLKAGLTVRCQLARLNTVDTRSQTHIDPAMISHNTIDSCNSDSFNIPLQRIELRTSDRSETKLLCNEKYIENVVKATLIKEIEFLAGMKLNLKTGLAFGGDKLYAYLVCSNDLRYRKKKEKSTTGEEMDLRSIGGNHIIPTNDGVDCQSNIRVILDLITLRASLKFSHIHHVSTQVKNNGPAMGDLRLKTKMVIEQICKGNHSSSFEDVMAFLTKYSLEDVFKKSQIETMISTFSTKYWKLHEEQLQPTTAHTKVSERPG